jgi:hypothetical protein
MKRVEHKEQELMNLVREKEDILGRDPKISSENNNTAQQQPTSFMSHNFHEPVMNNTNFQQHTYYPATHITQPLRDDRLIPPIHTYNTSPLFAPYKPTHMQNAPNPHQFYNSPPTLSNPSTFYNMMPPPGPPNMYILPPPSFTPYEIVDRNQSSSGTFLPPIRQLFDQAIVPEKMVTSDQRQEQKSCDST